MPHPTPSTDLGILGVGLPFSTPCPMHHQWWSTNVIVGTRLTSLLMVYPCHRRPCASLNQPHLQTSTISTIQCNLSCHWVYSISEYYGSKSTNTHTESNTNKKQNQETQIQNSANPNTSTTPYLTTSCQQVHSISKLLLSDDTRVLSRTTTCMTFFPMVCATWYWW